MYRRLLEVPVLDRFPSRIPAALWNAWRRYRGRLHGLIRIELEGLAPLALLIDEDAWAVVDTSLYDLPVVAWVDFRDDAERALHEPVPCTVQHYHQGAAKIRNLALEQLQQELERRLKGP
ncbi:hypothetical protein [Endothiovibrio diazotrophicus]